MIDLSDVPAVTDRTDLLFDHSAASSSSSNSMSAESVLDTVASFATTAEEDRPAVFNRMVHEMRQLK